MLTSDEMSLFSLAWACGTAPHNPTRYSASGGCPALRPTCFPIETPA